MGYPNYSVLSSVYIKERPDYLIKSLESIINQTVKTDDYVIVKDGPLTDELQQILDEYTQKYPYIHVYGYEKNKGLGYALNYGLRHCKNELVARMDTDDISMPKRCEKELECFLNNPKLDIVGSFIYEFSDSEENIIALKKMPVNLDDIRKYAKKRNPFNHPTVMYKKGSVIKHGGYLEGKRGEDISLFTKMIFEDCVGYNIPEPLLKYRAVSDQFKRRTSKLDSDAVINVMKDNYEKGYIGLLDLSYVIVTQTAGRIVPRKIGSIVFNKLYRTDSTLQMTGHNLYICNTPYHLILSCSKWEKDDSLICIGEFGECEIAKLLINSTFGCNTVIVKDFYHYRSSIKNLVYFRKEQKNLLNAFKKICFNNVILFNDVDPVAQWIAKHVSKNGDVIVIEEGIGLYRDTEKRYEKIFSLAGKIFFGKSFENVKRIGESSTVSMIECSDIEKLTSKQRTKRIKMLENIDFTSIANQLQIKQINGYSWFIGQTLVEDGVLKEKEYLSYIKTIEELAKEKGKRLIVKPHPRESIKKYKNSNINFLSDFKVPVELLIDTSETVNVYTMYSSAILNISKMKNVKAYALYLLFHLKVNFREDIFRKNNIVIAHDIKDII